MTTSTPADSRHAGARLRISDRSRDASACPSHRYPRGVGFSRRRPRAEDQARRPFSHSSIIRRWRSGKPPATKRSRSTASSRRKSTIAWSRSRKATTDRLRSTASGAPVEYRRRNDPLRRASDLRSSGRSRPARSRSRRRHRRRDRGLPRVAPLAPAEPWINSIPGIIEGNTAAFREAACFAADDIDDLGQASLSAFSRIRRLAGAARQAGICAAVPWRPASGEYRTDRRQAGPVRCDRVRSGDCIDRCALRSCVPDDGFHPLRPAWPPPTPCSTDIWRLQQATISTRSPRFHCSCRCDRRSAPMCCSPARPEFSRQWIDIMQSARAYFELARRMIHPPRADAGRGRRAVGNRKIRPGARARARIRRSREPLCCAATCCGSSTSRSTKPIGCPKAPTGRRLPRKSTRCWR